MKLNNRGMTLVEMIVAFAILGIVSTSIFSMMLTGTKTYTKLTNTVKVQYDTQLVTAKLEKHLMNCDDKISWNNNSLVIIDKERFVNAEENYDIKKTAHVFYLDGSELKYGVGALDETNGTVTVNVNLLAEHVKSFDVTLVPETDGSSVIKQAKLKIQMFRSDKTYLSEKTITFRSNVTKAVYVVSLNSETE